MTSVLTPWPLMAYTNMLLMRGGSQCSRALELEIRRRTAVRNLTIVEWHNLEMFAAPPKDQHLHYMSVPAFRQTTEPPRMLCMRSPPLFASYSSTFGNNPLRFGHLLIETAMTKFTIMSFVCFVRCCNQRPHPTLRFWP